MLLRLLAHPDPPDVFVSVLEDMLPLAGHPRGLSLAHTWDEWHNCAWGPAFCGLITGQQEDFPQEPPHGDRAWVGESVQLKCSSTMWGTVVLLTPIRPLDTDGSNSLRAGWPTCEQLVTVRGPSQTHPSCYCGLVGPQQRRRPTPFSDTRLRGPRCTRLLPVQGGRADGSPPSSA